MDVNITETTPPISLLDLLSNPIISDTLLPYLPLESIFRLARTSHPYRQFVYETPRLFRYLDLSKCRGAYVRPMPAIDQGGNSWRAERMDENLTEDEFYSGPLRGVFTKLDRMGVLQDVHTLILDELASVTTDLVHEIVTDPKFNVRILSIRRCSYVNPSRLQQLLAYICRPSRPEGTPTLQGLYLFTDPATERARTSDAIDPATGVTASDGAALGLLPVDKSRGFAAETDLWYAPSGQLIQAGSSSRNSWEETLQICKGIIVFDAVLCTYMHNIMSSYLHEASRDFLAQNKPGIRPIATIALGPEGCSSCGKAPKGTPVWSESDPLEFPLLSPPPFSGKIIDAVRPTPASVLASNGKEVPQRLIVSCTWCVVNRHCDSCHRWWCPDCYNPRNSKKLRDLETLSNVGVGGIIAGALPDAGASNSVKVFTGLCVENCLVGEMMAGAGSYGMWA